MQLRIHSSSTQLLIVIAALYTLLLFMSTRAEDSQSPPVTNPAMRVAPKPRTSEGETDLSKEIVPEMNDLMDLAKPLWICSAYGEHYWTDDQYRDFNLSGINIEFERRLREVKWLDKLSLGSSAGMHYAYGESQYWLDPNIYKAESFAPDLSVFGRFYILDFKQVQWFAEASVGGIWFDESFPPNGSRLNYLIRYGTGVRVPIIENWDVMAGYRHVQVSNGKGYNTSNPVYEGNGFFLGAGYKF